MMTKKALSLKIRFKGLTVRPIPQGIDFAQSFWNYSPTLEELAQAQGVKPMADVRDLFGTWPGDENDGFEAAIDELRHASTGRGDRP